MTPAPVLVDRTILAHPTLLAAAVIGCRRSGRTLMYRPEDWNSLLWQAAGQVLGWAYNDEFFVLRNFHADTHDLLVPFVPADAPVPSNAAPIVMLQRCIREGWVAPSDEDPSPELVEIFASNPPSVMWSLARYEGTLREFFVHELNQLVLQGDFNDDGVKAFYRVGEDASRVVPLHSDTPDWFQTELGKLFNIWIRDNDVVNVVQTCGSSIGQDPFAARDLQHQVRESLVFGIASAMNGDADYLTLSQSTNRLLEAFDAPRTDAKQIVKSGGGIATRLAAFSKATTVDALTYAIDQTERFELMTELVARDESVGGHIADQATGFLPSPLQVVVNTVRFMLRRRRRTGAPRL